MSLDAGDEKVAQQMPSALPRMFYWTENLNLFDEVKSATLAELQSLQPGDMIQWNDGPYTSQTSKTGLWKVESCHLEEKTFDKVSSTGFCVIKGNSTSIQSWKGMESASGRYGMWSALNYADNFYRTELYVRGDAHTNNTKVDQLLIRVVRASGYPPKKHTVHMANFGINQCRQQVERQVRRCLYKLAKDNSSAEFRIVGAFSSVELFSKFAVVPNMYKMDDRREMFQLVIKWLKTDEPAKGIRLVVIIEISTLAAFANDAVLLEFCKV